MAIWPWTLGSAFILLEGEASRQPSNTIYARVYLYLVVYAIVYRQSPLPHPYARCQREKGRPVREQWEWVEMGGNGREGTGVGEQTGR